MSRLLRLVGAALAIAILPSLTVLAFSVESAWAALALGMAVGALALIAVQLIVSAARSAARAAAHETDETLLRRYVAYRNELDRADGRAES